MKNRASERRIKLAIRQSNTFALIKAKNVQNSDTQRNNKGNNVYVRIVRG